MSERQTQIQWIVEYYFDNDLEHLSASNQHIENAFSDSLKIELSDRLWKDRIKAAAREIGLTGRLTYYPLSLPRAWAVNKEIIYS
jgi:hypothetical protein